MSGPTALDRAWQLAFQAAYPVARLWWRVRRRPHQGALVAIWAEGALLLVRASYRAGWSLPGGGMAAGETPAAAAQRELREELGLAVPLRDTPVVVRGTWDGRPETVHVFEARLPTRPTPRVDQREVVEARFFQPADLAGLRLSAPVRLFLQARGEARSAPEHQHA